MAFSRQPGSGSRTRRSARPTGPISLRLPPIPPRTIARQVSPDERRQRAAVAGRGTGRRGAITVSDDTDDRYEQIKQRATSTSPSCSG